MTRYSSCPGAGSSSTYQTSVHLSISMRWGPSTDSYLDSSRLYPSIIHNKTRRQPFPTWISSAAQITNRNGAFHPMSSLPPSPSFPFTSALGWGSTTLVEQAVASVTRPIDVVVTTLHEVPTLMDLLQQGYPRNLSAFPSPMRRSTGFRMSILAVQEKDEVVPQSAGHSKPFVACCVTDTMMVESLRLYRFRRTCRLILPSFCMHHRPTTDEHAEACLPQPTITFALIPPLPKGCKHTAKLAMSILGDWRILALELSIPGGISPSFGWLQAFMTEKKDWYESGSPRYNVPKTEALQAHSLSRQWRISSFTSSRLSPPYRLS